MSALRKNDPSYQKADRALQNYYELRNKIRIDLAKSLPSLHSIHKPTNYSALKALNSGANYCAAGLGVLGVAEKLGSENFAEDLNKGGLTTAGSVISVSADAANTVGGAVLALEKIVPKLSNVAKMASKTALPLAFTGTAAETIISYNNSEYERMAGSIGGLIGSVGLGAGASAITSLWFPPASPFAAIAGALWEGF